MSKEMNKSNDDIEKKRIEQEYQSLIEQRDAKVRHYKEMEKIDFPEEEKSTKPKVSKGFIERWAKKMRYSRQEFATEFLMDSITKMLQEVGVKVEE